MNKTVLLCLILSFSTIANATLKCGAKNEGTDPYLAEYTAHHGSHFSTSILKDIKDEATYTAKDDCAQDNYVLSVFDDSVGYYLTRRYQEITRLTNYSYYMNNVDQNHLPLIYAITPGGHKKFLKYTKGLARPKIYDIYDGGQAFLTSSYSGDVRKEASLSLVRFDQQKVRISGYALYNNESNPELLGTALINGEANIINNFGVFSKDGCYFEFKIIGSSDIKVVNDNGNCGGQNISFNGDYHSSSKI